MTLALRMFTSLLVRELWHGLDDTTIVGSFGGSFIAFPPVYPFRPTDEAQKANSALYAVSYNSRQLFRG